MPLPEEGLIFVAMMLAIFGAVAIVTALAAAGWNFFACIAIGLIFVVVVLYIFFKFLYNL